MNTVYHGDCFNILDQIPEKSVHLVYLDPPFFTQKVQKLQSRDLETYQFDDIWENLADYLTFIHTRLEKIHRVMRDDATLFFHCDRNASHHIRVLLDTIFGANHFLSEIIWTYKRWSNASRQLLPAHQTIFMVTKSDTYTFNHHYQTYSETTNVDQILQRRARNQHGKTTYAKDDEGNIILNGPKQGVPLSDVWEIPYLNPKAKERTGYPTQKPLQLMERIILLSSNEGDIVLDPFCGSGTTLVASQRHNRDYIGVDISSQAIELTQKRLKNPYHSTSLLLQKGREAYQNLPDDVVSLLNQLPVQLVQRNQGIDAIYNDYYQGKPILIRVQRHGEALSDAIQQLERAGMTKQAGLMILIRTEKTTQLNLFEQSLSTKIILVDSLALHLQSIIEEKLSLLEKL